MKCSEARESLSAKLDGEAASLGALADEHVGSCRPCLAWQLAAQDVVRRVRLSSATLDHDLSASILASLATASRRHWIREHLTRLATQRTLLLIVAIAQLAITIPLLLLGQTEEGGRHVAHELGSFDLALAVAFLVGAVRPRLSGGLAWPCGIAAVGLLATALIDVVTGHEPGVDEAQHLIAVVGAILLFWGARLYGSAPTQAAAPAALPGPAMVDPILAAAPQPPIRTRNAA